MVQNSNPDESDVSRKAYRSSPPIGEPVPYIVYQVEQPIELHKYFCLLLDHKKLIIVVTLLFTLASAAFAFLMTSIYRSEVLLAPVSGEEADHLSSIVGQFSDLAAVAGPGLSSNSNKMAALATLKSRSLSLSFIKEEDILPVLFAGRWNQLKGRWKTNEEIPTAWEAFDYFDNNIRFIETDRRTGLVKLIIEWKDPVLASRWANKLVERLNQRLRTEAIETAVKSIAYLEKQLRKTSEVEIQQAIYRLIESQTKEKMLASTREEYAFKVIDPAVVSEDIVKPRRTGIIVLGMFMGLLFSCVLVLIRWRTKLS